MLNNDGALPTETLTRVVMKYDEEITEQRGIVEDTVAQLHKIQRELEVERENHRALVGEFAEYRAHVNEMMRYGVKAKPCTCDGGYKIHFTEGTRNVRPWLRLVCVHCRARTSLRGWG